MDSMDERCVGVDGARHGWLAVWEQGGELAFRAYDEPFP